MRRLILGLAVLLCLGRLQTEVAADYVFDDFNDNTADGWVFPFNDGVSQSPGHWSVVDGELVQDLSTDHHAGLLSDYVFSDQEITTAVSTEGYAGVVLWYQQVNADWANYVSVFVYPFWGGVAVYEVRDGVESLYSYSHRTWHDTWYDLRVEATAATGELAMYVDGVYVDTFVTASPYRSGLSGVYSGNGEGYFDNFSVTAVPAPSSFAALVGIGVMVVGMEWWKKRRHVSR